MSFSSNPIVIKKDGRFLGFIELDLDPLKNSYILNIRNKRDEELFYGIIEEDTFLTYEVNNQVLKMKYMNVDTQHVFHEQVVDLYEVFGIIEDGEGSSSLKADRESLYNMLVQEVKEEMDSPSGTAAEIEFHTKMLNETTMSQEARDYAMNRIREVIERRDGLSESDVERYTAQIYADFYGMGILQELDDDETIGEIMVNVYVFPEFRSEIYYIRDGKKIRYDKNFKNLDEVKNVFSRAIAFNKKELNSLENAIVEANRSNRDRVNIIIPDASESYVMNIRKFGNFIPNSNSMKKYGTVDDNIERLMDVLVRGKANIGIGGEMGTGKTTFINYLLTFTQPIERKVVIASVSETDVDRVLKGHDVVILNVDDEKGFTFNKLMRSALRTTADRIIIPESRGEEFRQVYEANLKTKGNMFTAHALEDYAFLDMCVDMYAGDAGNVDVENLRNKIAKALDIIVIMRKVGSQIRIKSISEVVKDDKKNFERMNVLYEWESDPEDATKGRYVRTGNKMSEAFKIQLAEYGVPMSEILALEMM